MSAPQPELKREPKTTLYCSFCGKSQHEIKKLIAGPTCFICDECTELCMSILHEEGVVLKPPLDYFFAINETHLKRLEHRDVTALKLFQAALPTGLVEDMSIRELLVFLANELYEHYNIEAVDEHTRLTCLKERLNTQQARIRQEQEKIDARLVVLESAQVAKPVEVSTPPVADQTEG